ncbi:SGNH/GDSL hydrolase family protein [Bradyrhizobium sp. HKCCYLRH2015]|uniref:SGNH/GDSL hydrolase family protein n=1 Tax=Bradyrhizobium TaxID=374 RepID=UPI003EB94179
MAGRPGHAIAIRKRGSSEVTMTATDSLEFPDVATSFTRPIRQFRQSLDAQRKTRIVALGSSSTAGTNGIVAFPARIEQSLRKTNFGCLIDVLNRGVGGQESPEELSRFECDVIAEQPSLVIWQVGTNAAYRPEVYSPDEVEAALRVGLRWLAGLAIDAIVMDLQYTAAIVTVPNRLARAEDIQRRIEKVTSAANVNLFRRWNLMKSWHEAGQIPLSALDDGHGDRLHVSEAATAKISDVMASAIMTVPVVPA